MDIGDIVFFAFILLLFAAIIFIIFHSKFLQRKWKKAEKERELKEDEAKNLKGEFSDIDLDKALILVNNFAMAGDFSGTRILIKRIRKKYHGIDDRAEYFLEKAQIIALFSEIVGDEKKDIKRNVRLIENGLMNIRNLDHVRKVDHARIEVDKITKQFELAKLILAEEGIL